MFIVGRRSCVLQVNVTDVGLQWWSVGLSQSSTTPVVKSPWMRRMETRSTTRVCRATGSVSVSSQTPQTAPSMENGSQLWSTALVYLNFKSIPPYINNVCFTATNTKPDINRYIKWFEYLWCSYTNASSHGSFSRWLVMHVHVMPDICWEITSSQPAGGW